MVVDSYSCTDFDFVFDFVVSVCQMKEQVTRLFFELYGQVLDRKTLNQIRITMLMMMKMMKMLTGTVLVELMVTVMVEECVYYFQLLVLVPVLVVLLVLVLVVLLVLVLVVSVGMNIVIVTMAKAFFVPS